MDFIKSDYNSKPTTFVVKVTTSRSIALSTLVAAKVRKYQASHDLISVTPCSGRAQPSQNWILLFSKSARDIAERLDSIEKKLESIEHIVNDNFG